MKTSLNTEHTTQLMPNNSTFSIYRLSASVYPDLTLFICIKQHKLMNPHKGPCWWVALGYCLLPRDKGDRLTESGEHENFGI